MGVGEGGSGLSRKEQQQKPKNLHLDRVDTIVFLMTQRKNIRSLKKDARSMTDATNHMFNSYCIKKFKHTIKMCLTEVNI